MDDVDVLVTTLIVDDGVAVTLLLLLEPSVVSLVASFDVVAVFVPLLLLVLDLDVDDCVVVSVDVDDGVVLVLGNSESTTPIGPDKSISLFGHDNSSG